MSQRTQITSSKTTVTRVVGSYQSSVQRPMVNQAPELDHPEYQQRVRYNNADADRNIQSMDVVAFLMAVEIERLLIENTSLKSEIQDILHNGIDRVGYEMQIRDLIEKLKTQTIQIDQLTIDNTKLVNLVQEQDHEIQNLEDRIRELEELLRRMQNALGGADPNQIAKELDDLRDKARDYDNLMKDAKDLKDKMNDLNKALGDKDKENDDLRRRLAELEKQNKDLKNGLNDANAKLGDLDKALKDAKNDLDKAKAANDKLNKAANDNRGIQDELDRLKALLKKLQDENNRLKDDNNRLKQENADLNAHLDDLEHHLQDMDRQLQDANDAAKRAQDQFNKAQNDLKNAQNQLNQLIRENDKLKDENDKLHDANEEMNDKLQEDGNKTQEMQDEINKLLAIIGQQRDKIKELEAKFAQLRDLEEKLRQQEHRIALLMAEIERLNGLLKQALSDAEDWKQKYSRLELALIEYKQMEMTNRDTAAKANQLADELERLKALLLQRSKELEQLKRECEAKDRALQEAEQTQSNAVANNLKYLILAAEAQRLSAGYSDIFTKYTSLKAEYDTILVTFQQYEQALEGFGTPEDLKKKLLEYENKIALLSMETQRLRNATPNNRLQNSAGGTGEGARQRDASPMNSSSSKKEIDRLNKKIQDLLCLIILMTAELEQLRGLADSPKLQTTQVKSQAPSVQNNQRPPNRQTSPQAPYFNQPQEDPSYDIRQSNIHHQLTHKTETLTVKRKTYQ